MEDGHSLAKASALAKFAAQLRAWRQRSGWSQAELADKLLCSDSLVSGVETMNKTPTLDYASVAYTECKGGGMIVESAAQVAELMTTVNLIRAVSLPPRESMNLIMQIRSEIDDE